MNSLNKLMYIVAAALVVIFCALKNVEPLPQVQVVLGHKTMSLDKRYGNTFVNSVFKDNILLTLAYLHGQVKNQRDISWNKVREPNDFTVIIDPGKTFAYHDTVMPQYDGKIESTTHAHFNETEGFESDGYLMGDGVCHLASLINWAAQDAGLKVEAPVRHDFAVIPEVPAQYGVSIYDTPTDPVGSARQNLYITNTLSSPLGLRFTYDGVNLTVSVVKELHQLAQRGQEMN